ncbi:MAG: putative RNA methyltransferase [Ktedonobacteraceae bacterium]
MFFSHLQYIVCPLCTTPFVATERTLTCAHGHSFDLAKEGYAHFLRKPLPGDTKEMLKARRDFFAQDHYRPLSEAINEHINAYVQHQSHTRGEPLVICDAGCGEGYYLSRLQTALAEQEVPITYLGLDISKEAVRMAAKRCQDAFFIVTNLKERLAVTDASLHVILNIFAPRNLAEFARVLTPGGLLLVVIPAPTHLQTIRDMLHLLQIEENKQQHVIAQFTAQGQFQLEGIVPVTYILSLQGAEIAQLVTMTPNYWHTTEETRQAMTQITEVQTEVACLCLTFRRT